MIDGAMLKYKRKKIEWCVCSNIKVGFRFRGQVNCNSQPSLNSLRFCFLLLFYESVTRAFAAFCVA